LDEEPGISTEQLIASGLVPEERPFVVPRSVQEKLRMIEPDQDKAGEEARGEE
jgi:hypothetical protein